MVNLLNPEFQKESLKILMSNILPGSPKCTLKVGRKWLFINPTIARYFIIYKLMQRNVKLCFRLSLLESLETVRKK